MTTHERHVPVPSPIREADVELFNEGAHHHLYRCLGAHPDAGGTWFAVWAPNARSVRVAVDVDAAGGSGRGQRAQLSPVGTSGIWSGRVERAGAGLTYRYLIGTQDGRVLEKVDPVGAATVEPPATASVIADLDHEWEDHDWMGIRGARIALDAPVSIYELHVGSWGRHAPLTPGRRFPRYDELADPIADHVLTHGFTHVELLPIMEHPYYGSWGYQTTGYFAPSARYGSPVGLMRMIDRLHQRGVGVILDWVPSHFPTDDHGLARFDGPHLYEHADPRLGYHPDWTSAIFDYGRPEVRSFLVSSALSWLDHYHVDGLRVDAVASMLYLDYSRGEGEWVPNRHGGRENLEAIVFLRQLNEAVYGEFPDVATFAEESTAWPMVSRPTEMGGLGFGYKWDMGWMHDTLQHLQRPPVDRRWHHGELTFRSAYAGSENFVLPLSHDEVVHAKGSLLTKMPGERWQQFANLRLLLSMQWTQPGKKLLFMGDELAAPTEWAHEGVLDWGLYDTEGHAGVRTLVADLNRLYGSERALHAGDAGDGGFAWLITDDADRGIYAFLRLDPTSRSRPVLVVWNTSSTRHPDVRVGVPAAGRWSELLNTDAAVYGGSSDFGERQCALTFAVGVGSSGQVDSAPVAAHGHSHSVVLTMPPLATIILAPGPPLMSSDRDRSGALIEDELERIHADGYDSHPQDEDTVGAVDPSMWSELAWDER